MVIGLQNATPISEKEKRFRRLAEKRVNAVLDKLRLVGQLSNKQNYSYTTEQTETIFRAINKEVRATKARFDTANGGGKKFALN